MSDLFVQNGLIIVGLLVLIVMLDTIQCGKLRDKDTGATKSISCLERLAIWLDRKNR